MYEKEMEPVGADEAQDAFEDAPPEGGDGEDNWYEQQPPGGEGHGDVGYVPEAEQGAAEDYMEVDEVPEVDVGLGMDPGAMQAAYPREEEPQPELNEENLRKQKKEKKEKKEKRERSKEQKEQAKREREEAAPRQEAEAAEEEERQFKDRTEERRWRKEDREEGKKKFSCYGYITTLAREIGFSLWFRIYVYMLLLGNLTFVVLLGYYFMFATTYRMSTKPEETTGNFFREMALQCTFWLVLTFASSLIWVNLRLTVSWMGMSRQSCNLFLLPNRYGTAQKALFLRDYQLFFFEILVLLVPVIYAIWMTAQNSQSVLSFIGHFSFFSFVVFQILVFVMYLFFWYRSISEKRRAWKVGKKLMEDARQLADDDETSSSDDDDTDDERDRRARKKHKDDYDSDDEERGARRKSKKRRRHRQSEGENDSRSKPILWHWRRLSNPEVMSEFGLDLYSLQAYYVHCFLGLVWVLLSAYWAAPEIRRIEYLFIFAVVIIGSLLLALTHSPHKKDKKIAMRQRRVSWILFICWMLFLLLTFAGALLTVPMLAVIMFVLLFLNQGNLVRRHDMHVRDNLEAGKMILPEADSKDRKKKRRHQRVKHCLPLVPCGGVWRVCCTGCCNGCCTEPMPFDQEVHSSDAPMEHDVYKHGSLAASDTRLIARARTYADRDGRLDKVMRPGENPGFSMRGTSSDYTETKNGKDRLTRELYLNTRERVLQADAMVMTWYFAIFLLILGIVSGMGRDVEPEFTVPITSTSVDSDREPYLICSMSFHGVRIQDLAMATFATYTGKQTEFRRANYETELSGPKFPSQEARNRENQPKHAAGPHLLWDTYTFPNNVSVVVVKKALNGSSARHREWLRDFDAWSESMMLQVLSALNPLFALWDPDDQKNFVSFLGSIKTAMQEESGVREMDLLVEFLKAQPSATVVTGHGMNGGWAKLAARKSKSSMTAVAFAPPGTLWARGIYDVDEEEARNEVSLVPQRAALTLLDRHTGFVQETECSDGNSMTDCQNIKLILCDILRHCGSTDSYEGFNSECKA